MRPFILALLIVPAVLAAPLPVHAQANPAACAAIAADSERLACYDAVFRAPAGDPAALPPVVLSSTQPIPARPTGRKPATMTVACTAGELGVSFAFAGQLLSETSDDAAISFQVRQAGSRARSLPVSADNQSIAFPSSRDADAFLETLEGSDNLIVRITPVRQRSVQVQFNLRASEGEIQALREACAG
jgi:hypothetical protein